MYGIGEQIPESPLPDIIRAVQFELKAGAGRLMGYTQIWRRIQSVHGLISRRWN